MNIFNEIFRVGVRGWPTSSLPNLLRITDPNYRSKLRLWYNFGHDRLEIGQDLSLFLRRQFFTQPFTNDASAQNFWRSVIASVLCVFQRDQLDEPGDQADHLDDQTALCQIFSRITDPDYRSKLRIRITDYGSGSFWLKMDQDLPHFFADNFSRDHTPMTRQLRILNEMYMWRSVIAPVVLILCDLVWSTWRTWRSSGSSWWPNSSLPSPNSVKTIRSEQGVYQLSYHFWQNLCANF